MRLRPLLLVSLLLLQAIAVAAVVVITGRSSETVLLDAMGRTMRLAVETMDQRTAEHLRPAEDAARLGAELVADDVLTSSDDVEILRYLDAQVLSNRSITGAYVGRPDGSFLLVSRDGATITGGTRVKTITVEGSVRRSVTVQRDLDGVVQQQAEDPADTFDPRARPWYEAASAANGIAWTEPYVFFASREPGITAASAARDGEGSIVAVVGIDLSLRDLSTFVGRMEVGDDSRSILFDDTGHMVAAADVEHVNVDDGEGGLRRATVGEVTDPVVAAGVAGGRPLVGMGDAPTAPRGRRGSRSTGAGGRPRSRPLAARPSWYAAVIAPEDQFVTNVVDAQRDNALRAVLVGLAVTALAFPRGPDAEPTGRQPRRAGDHRPDDRPRQPSTLRLGARRTGGPRGAGASRVPGPRRHRPVQARQRHVGAPGRRPGARGRRGAAPRRDARPGSGGSCRRRRVRPRPRRHPARRGDGRPRTRP